MKSALLGAYVFVFLCDQMLDWPQFTLSATPCQPDSPPVSSGTTIMATVERALAYENG